MIFASPAQPFSPLRRAINSAYRMDETECLQHLVAETFLDADQQSAIAEVARKLVSDVREARLSASGLDTFMTEYDLSSEEGIALMCLAEALLRVPDKRTIDRLIRDKISSADWQKHLKSSDNVTINAATWALMLTGKVLTESDGNIISRTFKKLVTRTGEPVIRRSVEAAMRILSKQFVMGRTIEEAMKRARPDEVEGYRYSYDMLGEAARTQADADKYYAAYYEAITSVGDNASGDNIDDRAGVSIKLSALHPRYESSQSQRVLDELTPKVLTLVKHARDNNVQVTMDAEEADRLDLSLDIFEAVLLNDAIKGWPGFGLALQSYQKRAWYVIDYLADLANRSGVQLRVRLIKGAYWDSEIKHYQMEGVDNYPVFTRKNSTDLSFIACAKKILDYPEQFYPQFATHNAYSVACILEMVGDRKDYEFQALHGMGKTLYRHIVGKENYDIACRIYAPVGSHEDLLPYLVRRLLENGANSSFVNRIVDSDAPVDELVKDPILQAEKTNCSPHPKIPLSKDIFMPERANSVGPDLSDRELMLNWQVALQPYASRTWHAGPIVNGVDKIEAGESILAPQHHEDFVGQVSDATEGDVDRALLSASRAADRWSKEPARARSNILESLADLLEQNTQELIALAVREAGKTIQDAIAEIREAVDFCRYYAVLARKTIAEHVSLSGYTGETNTLSYHGRGTILCISPWNFPLAIFTGQVVAALVAGNCVVAKPAEQTPLIAHFTVKLMHQAGIPKDVLHFLPGPGDVIGAALVADERINGVMFTGSTQTAKRIQQSLTAREGELVPLIAETGGQNAMIVDSSALPEQVTMDVLTSAFGSAGQRCSALRVLFLQDVVADKILSMLCGAMDELTIGDPQYIATDIGPVIDKGAQTMLQDHINKMQAQATIVHACHLPAICHQGTYVAPHIIEIKDISELNREIFGPILHVVRYNAKDLDEVIHSINKTGYGLTLGIHSRINETIQHVIDSVKVGNCYVNRSTIGAVVGLQPFGGEGLSGTGPKAGGPNYLRSLCHERTLTVNTTAAGGNASLMSLDEDDSY